MAAQSEAPLLDTPPSPILAGMNPERPGPAIIIHGKGLHEIVKVTKSVDSTDEITIYQADIDDILPQLQSRFAAANHPHYKDLERLLLEWMGGPTPDKILLAAKDSYPHFFSGTESFFQRWIADNSKGTGKLTVTIEDLRQEWQYDMYTVMEHWLKKHYEQALKDKFDQPVPIGELLHEGVPKIVWKVWWEALRELTVVLAWRHKQLK
ncbi:hypothetical protein K504DRAFT_456158 [Pleomassaria siparia CBS 279.74]|uniref:Uncharacterized protein n=1 Tax=Pleomassaria siparia CBS 279.74 TaxID=1314801 RepID=A0A6G1K6M6_9PLEO|nr:hypothetical protein K504DRAFT_456158 [Pleomassaria siparia CBS 279.74]